MGAKPGRRDRIGPGADQFMGQRREQKGRNDWSSGLSLPLTLALNSRLSPEIYLKRPAHSDDWRLDLMLKKKAVRRVVRLEARWWGLPLRGGGLEGTAAWGR